MSEDREPRPADESTPRGEKLEIVRQQETGREAESAGVSQSFWSLVWWKFKKNKLAIAGGIIVILLYLTCVVIPEFMAPYRNNQESDWLEVQPMRPHFRDEAGNWHLRPFVYGYEEVIDLKTVVPLDIDAVVESVKKTGRLLIVHEACKKGGIGAEIACLVMDKAFDYLDASIMRVGEKEAPIPFAEPLENAIVPGVAEIKEKCLELVGS